MELNFEHLTNVVERKKVEIVSNEFPQNYILMCIQNRLPIESINFDAFDLDDIWDVRDGIEECITDESQDGEICLDPHHPYTRMMNLRYKISEFQDTPKEIVPSPFAFI